jgi:3',5'-nucleoside bisphosphate phosphatase
MNIYADLHIHSCLSPCGDVDMTPGNICAMAKIKGLQAIAITDHNSARNLTSAKTAADINNLVLLPGMEITTREEVHLLAYFPSVEKALEMGHFLFSHLPDIKNDPRLFGKQQVMDDSDACIGVEDKLLISATDLSLRQTVLEIVRHAGLPVPAHINRGANGLIQCLGFLPEDIVFPALEVSNALPVAPEILNGKSVLHSSDAHRLEDILEAVFQLDVADVSPLGILKAIGYQHMRIL